MQSIGEAAGNLRGGKSPGGMAVRAGAAGDCGGRGW